MLKNQKGGAADEELFSEVSPASVTGKNFILLRLLEA